MYRLGIKNALVGLFLATMVIFYGCKPKQVIVEKEKVVYVHSDSTIVHDSIVYIPTEIYRDYSSLLDTLYLSTSMAESRSWIDTNNYFIVGEIKNLKAVQVKYIEVEKIVTNDSIVEKEVPVPYEVEVVKTKIPTWAWWCLFISIGLLCYFIWKIYKRFFL